MKLHFSAWILVSVLGGCSTPKPSLENAQVLDHSIELPQLTTRISMAPNEVRHGERVTITVLASNHTEDEILAPFYHVMDGKLIMNQTGVAFVSDLDSRPPIIGNPVDTNPPIFDRVAPGETRNYRLTWTPRESDLGSGYLLVELPLSFQKVDPLPIKVTRLEDSSLKRNPDELGELGD